MSVSLRAARLPALLGDRPRQLAAPAPATSPSEARTRRPSWRPPHFAASRPGVGDRLAIHARRRSGRAGAGFLLRRTSCSSARTPCRTRGPRSRRSRRRPPSSACRTRLTVALRTNSSRLARSCLNCGAGLAAASPRAAAARGRGGGAGVAGRGGGGRMRRRPACGRRPRRARGRTPPAALRRTGSDTPR